MFFCARSVSSRRSPSMPPGSMRSSITASNASLAAMNSPSRPLSACSTTWPASFSPRTTKPATSLSSSTTRMRIAPVSQRRSPGQFGRAAADGDRNVHVPPLAADRSAAHCCPAAWPRRRGSGRGRYPPARRSPRSRRRPAARRHAPPGRCAPRWRSPRRLFARLVLDRDAEPAAVDVALVAQFGRRSAARSRSGWRSRCRPSRRSATRSPC